MLGHMFSEDKHTPKKPRNETQTTTNYYDVHLGPSAFVVMEDLQVLVYIANT